MWTHYVARDTKPEILADMPSKHVPKVDRFPSTIETPASNGEVREENSVEAEPVKNGGEANNPDREEPPQLPPVSFEDAVPAAPEPEVTPEQPAVNGHEQPEYYQQEQSSEAPTEATDSSPQVPPVENAPLISEVQGDDTPPVEVPLEPSANGISYGAGGNGWEVCSFIFILQGLCKREAANIFTQIICFSSNFICHPSGIDSQKLSFLFCFGFPGPKSSWIGNGQLILKHLIFNSFSLNHDHPQTHELNNGAGSHYETESSPAEAPLAAKRPLEQEEEEEANQQEAKRVREDGDGEQQQRGEDEDEVEHHGEQQQQQQQQVVPSPQLPIHTGGD